MIDEINKKGELEEISFKEMIKFECILTLKEFEIELRYGIKTFLRCPHCHKSFYVYYPMLGVSDRFGIEVEDNTYHSIKREVYNGV